MNFIVTLPYALITQGIYSGLIGTISTITMGTCGIITSIYNHKNPDVTKFLKKLDIEKKLNLIESVLDKYSSQKKITTDSSEIYKLYSKNQNFNFKIMDDYEKKSDPIELCLQYLREIITDIHLNLTDIDNTVKYHKTKWFNSWRKLSIKKKLEQLEINSNLLDKRFNDLIKITELVNKSDIRIINTMLNN